MRVKERGGKWFVVVRRPLGDAMRSTNQQRSPALPIGLDCFKASALCPAEGLALIRLRFSVFPLPYWEM